MPRRICACVVVEIPASNSDLSLQSETRFLQLLQPVPAHLAANAEALRAAYSEYQERSLARTGLRKIYLVTLTLTLLLAIFGAIAAAFLIAGDLAQPLLVLAEGTKAVAEGNLSPRPIVATSDELGTLTQSFNTMTRQLSEARASAERNRAALSNAKAYLESVLANMSAGVMVLDSQLRLVTCNESVERILLNDFDAHIGKPLAAIDGLERSRRHSPNSAPSPRAMRRPTSTGRSRSKCLAAAPNRTVTMTSPCWRADPTCR
jgi:nitrogen fixation/metabolism regulation signal transduction histidine kinase